MKSLYKCQQCKKNPCALIDKGLKWCGACWIADALGKYKINYSIPLETVKSRTI